MTQIVSFYTPEYEGEVKGWKVSMAKTGLPFYAQRTESRGSWRKNCGLKPGFMLECLARFNDACLWIDIDGRVLGGMPELESAPDEYDFGCFFIPWDQMNRNDKPGGPKSQTDGTASGTMFVNNTVLGRDFMRRWIEMDHGQHQYEQIVLGETWHGHRPGGLRTWRMPQRYCKVFDRPWKRGEAGPVQIEHYQASRRLRRKVR